ncbi:protoheme IX farnesyltransferase [Rubellimicrobium thermophilum DSM 16684]|uniref:Protoheme IX farnesyltransferase n=1 Tax=Rubellimicrobium thermophilum DSM 16684 TaxID=1123069 RepID=S9R5W3_9RHOB|nr:heme o synthase [Rubellimicrobium thermophilum]EPX87383.1 protoheme IX farnesyltransferase [Rubellimicrobium thermophilum DSM 16684]
MSDASLTTRLGPAAAPAGEGSFGDYFALLKPRVMSLVIFTALAGMIAAPGAMHPFVGFVALLCIAVGAGASGALNMWWDADIDRLMRRTRGRPVPSGRIGAGEALGLGVALSLFSVMMLGLAANWFAAGLLAFTIFFYAVVYTMWLKRRTPQNIVIGGLAGALPPLVAWVAATGSVAWAPLLMVALIFLWTPPHFWALALFVRGDYGRANVPMLTETHGDRATRNQIALYAVLLAPASLALALSAAGGWLTFGASILLTVLFGQAGWAVWRRDAAQAEGDGWAAEKRLFRLSLFYMAGHFAAVILDSLLGTGWGG